MVSYVATEFWPRPKLSLHNIFVSRQSWPDQKFSIVTECFNVTTELAMVERLYVVIEHFMSQQSVAK